ncbi:MAG: dihydropteroate synthase [Chloroflexi bacterium]|nr:dihydropteroate synthase [Chloroflexota bacterium]
MERIGTEASRLQDLIAKGSFYLLKLEGVDLAIAKVIKDLSYQMGAAAVIGRSDRDRKQATTDMLILATQSQLQGLVLGLREGGADGAQVATTIEQALAGYRGEKLGSTRCGNIAFDWGARTYVMGIINVTPDSFSGDGVNYDVSRALEQARRFVSEGADIIDIGGESTRPGSMPITVEEELARVLPVVERLAQEIPIPLSIDTHKAEVVRRALLDGAAMVNDVWGLKADPQMASVVAEVGVPVILMHNQRQPTYRDLMADVIRGLRESIDIALAAGVNWENLIVDPGVGFGKTKDHNLEIMQRLDELRVLGRPILVGTSRKSTIGYVLDLPVDQRLEGTAATVALAIAGGADIVRVHDVREMVRVARMSDAIVRRPWLGSS